MPILSPSAPKTEKRKRMKEEMDKWKAGSLHSGSKKGPVVRNYRQALAISLNDSGQGRKSKNRKSSRSSGRR